MHRQRPAGRYPAAHGITVAVRHPGRRPRCARPAQWRRPAHPAGVQPGPRRPRRHRGLPQVREPPASGLLQDPGRLHAHGPPLRRGEGQGRGRRERGQPRPGGGPRRPAARHQGQGLHAPRGADAQAGGDPGLRRRHRAGRHHHRRVPGQGPGVGGRDRAPSSSTPSTTATSWPVRAPVASRSSRSAPTSGPSSSAPGAAACWPASPRRSRRSSPTCGSSACRPSRPRPTRCRSRRASPWPSRTCRPWPTASRSACPAMCPTPSSATSSTAWRR